MIATILTSFGSETDSAAQSSGGHVETETHISGLYTSTRS
jgi:hypothetical protein